MGKPSIKWSEPEQLVERLASGGVAGVLSGSKLEDLDREFVVVDRAVTEAHGTIRLLGGVEFPSGPKAVETLGDKIDPVAAESFREHEGPAYFHPARLVESTGPRPIGKAVWSTAYVNDLPDSAFLHVEPGGKKDENGRTVPRSLRHFPIRDAEGALDLPHLRNAIARIPQAKIPGLTPDDLRRLQEKARKLLADATRQATAKGAPSDASPEGGQDTPATFKTRARPLWGSPAGKGRVAAQLAALLPAHETYVEPFAGSAAVLYSKAPAAREVISDSDGTIVEAFKILKGLTPEQLDKLARLPWKGDRATFERLRASSPGDPVSKLHRFAYLTRFSHAYKRGHFSPSHDGAIYSVEHARAAAARLRNVIVEAGDYEPVIRKYDGPSTAFFLDPPYAGHNVNVGESKFDEERFANLVKSLKGKVLITYGTRGKLPGLLREAGFHIARIATRRTFSNAPGASPTTQLEQVVATNYPIGNKAARSFVGKLAEIDPEALVVFDDPDGEIDLAKRERKLRPLWKSPGGKSAMAAQIAAMLPPHRTYVEPFAGSGAVLYAKEKSEREVVNDLDPLISAAWKALPKLTNAEIKSLAGRDWKSSEATFKRLKAAGGSSAVEQLHKLLYLSRFSFVGTRASYDKTSTGQVARVADRLTETRDRLRGLRAHGEDYAAVVRRYDAPDTVFFFDPPYVGSYGLDRTASENKTSTGERAFDERKFAEVLKGIKGKWIVTYGTGGELPKLLKAAGYKVKRIATPARMKTRRATSSEGETLINLVFSNFGPTRKAEGQLAAITDGDLVALLDALAADYAVAKADELLDVAAEVVAECTKRGVEIVESPLAAAVRSAIESESALVEQEKQRVDTMDPETLPLSPSAIASEKTQPGKPAEAGSSATTGENDGSEIPEIGEIQILKSDDLRYVLGIALEPNDGDDGAPLDPDTQRDVYSAEDIRKAAWLFFRRYRAAGDMHERKLSDREIEVVESYVAPVDFEIDGQRVRKGSWLVGAHIVSDKLWSDIRSGRRTAWSVDGKAKRRPFEG